MVLISYQVLFTELVDFKKELVLILKNAYEKNYDESEENILNNSIDIKYRRILDQYKFLIGFDLVFQEIGTEIDEVVDDFNEGLKEHDKISLIIKLYDEKLFNKLAEIHKKLFDIEMRLREVISLIFLDTYKIDYYNLLKDVDLKPRFEGKNNLQKDEVQRRDFLSKRFENEFFHILFSDYTKLSTPRDLKHDDLYVIAEISNNFEEFKENIMKRGVTYPIHINFINNIKEVMGNLERIRNCVAHNRSLDEDDLKNYDKYFEEVDKHIIEFFSKLEKACPKCGGEVETIQTSGGQDSDGQPSVVHYKVQCKDCGVVFQEDTVDI